MGDGVAFADIGEKLVSEALALGGAAHQSGDVDKSQAGRDDFLRPGDLGQHFKARIGHGDIADIGLDGAEGIIGRLRRRRLRQGVEQGGFADVRQADNAAFETHVDARPLKDKELFAAFCGPRDEKASPAVLVARPYFCHEHFAMKRMQPGDGDLMNQNSLRVRPQASAVVWAGRFRADRTLRRAPAVARQCPRGEYLRVSKGICVAKADARKHLGTSHGSASQGRRRATRTAWC